MANIINKARSELGKGIYSLNEYLTRESVTQLLGSELNKAWRAKILLDRLTRQGPKDKFSDIKTLPNEGTPKILTSSTGTKYIKQGKNPIDNKQVKDTLIADNNKIEVNFLRKSSENISELGDRSTLREYSKVNTGIRLYNFLVSPAEWILLQTVPKELDFKTDSTWAVIQSMGRNVPMYHYTGGESKLNFNISWYCTDKTNPQEVVTKCRLLESWSKANGYFSSPPVIEIQWGDSELFKDQYWIITSATYKLSNWRATARIWDKESKSFKLPDGYVEPQMYPATATQELELRRVSSVNLSYEDFVPKAWLEKTQGYKKSTNSSSNN